MDVKLLDFSSPTAVLSWRAIDDRVMGGASSSRLCHHVDGYAVFQGEVSFDNGGGFASVRDEQFRIESPAVRALQIKVRGDGKRYKLNLRMDDGFDGVSYQAPFQPPAGQWSVIRLEFEHFLPTFRGRMLSDVPSLDGLKVRQIGLMIGDRQLGTFSLALGWIDPVP